MENTNCNELETQVEKTKCFTNNGTWFKEEDIYEVMLTQAEAIDDLNEQYDILNEQYDILSEQYDSLSEQIKSLKEEEQGKEEEEQGKEEGELNDEDKKIAENIFENIVQALRDCQKKDSETLNHNVNQCNPTETDEIIDFQIKQKQKLTTISNPEGVKEEVKRLYQLPEVQQTTSSGDKKTITLKDKLFNKNVEVPYKEAVTLHKIEQAIEVGSGILAGVFGLVGAIFGIKKHSNDKKKEQEKQIQDVLDRKIFNDAIDGKQEDQREQYTRNVNDYMIIRMLKAFLEELGGKYKDQVKKLGEVKIKLENIVKEGIEYDNLYATEREKVNTKQTKNRTDNNIEGVAKVKLNGIFYTQDQITARNNRMESEDEIIKKTTERLLVQDDKQNLSDLLSNNNYNPGNFVRAAINDGSFINENNSEFTAIVRFHGREDDEARALALCEIYILSYISKKDTLNANANSLEELFARQGQGLQGLQEEQEEQEQQEEQEEQEEQKEQEQQQTVELAIGM